MQSCARATFTMMAAIAMVSGCPKEEEPVTPVTTKQVPIACRLDALSEAEREREGDLLQEHIASIQETREREDGYSFRYPADHALFLRMAELVALEHQCCPFLDFALEWKGVDDSPWLHVTGGARIKVFVAGTFGTQHPSGQR